MSCVMYFIGELGCKLFSLNLFAEFYLPDGDIFWAADMQCYNNHAQVLYDTWISADFQASSDHVTVDWNVASICRFVT